MGLGYCKCFVEDLFKKWMWYMNDVYYKILLRIKIKKDLVIDLIVYNFDE